MLLAVAVIKIHHQEHQNEEKKKLFVLHVQVAVSLKSGQETEGVGSMWMDTACCLTPGSCPASCFSSPGPPAQKGMAPPTVDWALPLSVKTASHGNDTGHSDVGSAKRSDSTCLFLSSGSQPMGFHPSTGSPKTMGKHTYLHYDLQGTKLQLQSSNKYWFSDWGSLWHEPVLQGCSVRKAESLCSRVPHSPWSQVGVNLIDASEDTRGKPGPLFSRLSYRLSGLGLTNFIYLLLRVVLLSFVSSFSVLTSYFLISFPQF